MNYDEIEELLKKYHWILESISPLNIRSEDGEHYAQNYGAEVTIEYFALVDQSDDEETKEDLMNRFKLIQQQTNEGQKLQTDN